MSDAPPVLTHQYWINEQSDHKKGSDEACIDGVQKVLREKGFAEIEDIGARIGKVMTSPVVPTCCPGGTDFDHFINGFGAKDEMHWDDLVKSLNAKTAMVVVDVQKDFTRGSFGQPCWGAAGERGDGQSKLIAKLMYAVADAGGIVLASKDFHGKDHCSFGHSKIVCQNTKDYPDKDLEFTIDKRYVNQFPAHCTYDFDKDGKAVPQKTTLPGADFIGAALDPIITNALMAIRKKHKDRAEVVFKGFHDTYDSFSVYPHKKNIQQNAKEETKWTGGYALPEKQAQACFESGHDLENLEHCYPNKEQLANPTTEMRGIADILKGKGITQVFPVGLVYDFCVKETSIFAKEDGFEKVVMPVNFARPSFDGKPGMPWMGAACGQEPNDNFCKAGAGTQDAHKGVLADYHKGGVTVPRITKLPAV
jgi:nicotinamidase-related amidase